MTWWKYWDSTSRHLPCGYLLLVAPAHHHSRLKLSLTSHLNGVEGCILAGPVHCYCTIGINSLHFELVLVDPTVPPGIVTILEGQSEPHACVLSVFSNEDTLYERRPSQEQVNWLLQSSGHLSEPPSSQILDCCPSCPHFIHMLNVTCMHCTAGALYSFMFVMVQLCQLTHPPMVAASTP